MSRYMSQYRASDLLDKLSEKGLIERDHQAIENFVIETQQEKELPLYLRGLVSFGAFIASICFISLIIIGIQISDETGFLLSGLGFISSAILLHVLGGNTHTAKGSVLMQSSFAFMLAGKALFVIGVACMFESGWAATMALLTVTVATYHVYSISMERFFSTCAVLVSVCANILWDKELVGSKELLFNGFILLQMMAAAVLIINVKIKRDYIPLTYGLLFSLCVNVLFLASYAQFDHRPDEEVISPIFVTLLFSGSLIALISWLFGGLAKLNTAPARLACLGVVLLGLISAPGIIFSIVMMVLGYAKHEKVMITMGALLMPVFLYFYYYNLDISLMEKSGVLVASGIVLLAGYVYIGFKGWDKGGAL